MRGPRPAVDAPVAAGHGDKATPPAHRQRMKTALDLLHGIRVELTSHENEKEVKAGLPQLLLVCARRQSQGQAARRTCCSWAFLDSDEDAQGYGVLDMADQEEELAHIDPYTTTPTNLKLRD
ncbi:uncharacterized protein [Lolium perenne]|uniref:uncharacterized protein n=1 Tax=Lolium perenne TaxID=4522 RepID=UPI0021F5B7C6|nr:uncharacterized protein LOC127331664 isoform X1 [Lolium perenne]XP_051213801.1 uncharacterized protein LOC127331664 isoform X2 [Lolium perenne]